MASTPGNRKKARSSRAARTPRGGMVRLTRQGLVDSRSVYVNPRNVLWIDPLPDIPGADAPTGSAIYLSGTAIPLMVHETPEDVAASLGEATDS